MHISGEKDLKKNHFFWEKSFLSAIFNSDLVQMITNRYARLKNTLTIDVSFESEFLRFFERKKKRAFYEKCENHEKHQLKINVSAFIYLGLVGHNLQSLLSPFSNRKFSPLSHTSGFGVKIKKSIQRYF